MAPCRPTTSVHFGTGALCQLTSHYANSLPIMPTHSLCQLTSHCAMPICSSHLLLQAFIPNSHLIFLPNMLFLSYSFILCSYYANFLSICHTILLSFQLPAEWQCSLTVSSLSSCRLDNHNKVTLQWNQEHLVNHCLHGFMHGFIHNTEVSSV